MNAVEPEPEPIRTGHAAFGNGQLVVTYLVDGHIEIPVYAADAPLVAGECQPAITLEISPAEAHLLAAQISDAAYRVNAAAGEDDSVAGGLLDMALAAAAAIGAEFNGILPGRLQELTDELVKSATAWKRLLDTELADWNPLRLVPPSKDDEDGDR
jgi:hypothetical protein